MPEHFVISLIIDDTSKTDAIALDLFNTLKMRKGRSNIHKSEYPIFDDKEIVASIVKWDFYFDEIFIAISDQVFNKLALKDELENFTNFIDFCFKFSKNIKFALCAYEINASLLSEIKGIKDINNEFLSKFPIAFTRQHDGKPLLHINLAAQDIFTLFPCTAS